MKLIIKKLFSVFFVILLTQLCTACLEIEQEIWLNADGTARMTNSFVMNLAPLKEMEKAFATNGKKSAASFKSQMLFKKADILKLERQLKADPDVTSAKVTSNEKDGRITFLVEVSVKNWTALNRVQRQVDEQKKSKDKRTPAMDKLLSAKKETILLLQKFPASKGSPKSSEVTNAMAQNLLGDSHIELTIHAPKILSHNGEKKDAHTVHWMTLLSDDVKKSRAHTWKATFKLK